HQVVVACAGIDVAMQAERDLAWDDLARRDPVPTEAMRADEPLLLLYTSGTTGRPKGTVHGHAGLPIKAAQDWALGMDVRAKERVMWVTDMGWVMGPLLVFGSLELALRGRGAGRAAHHELLRGHRVWRRPRLRKFPDAIESRQLRGSDPRHRRGGLQRARPARAGRGRRAGCPPPLPGYDAR